MIESSLDDVKRAQRLGFPGRGGQQKQQRGRGGQQQQQGNGGGNKGKAARGRGGQQQSKPKPTLVQAPVSAEELEKREKRKLRFGGSDADNDTKRQRTE